MDDYSNIDWGAESPDAGEIDQSQVTGGYGYTTNPLMSFSPRDASQTRLWDPNDTEFFNDVEEFVYRDEPEEPLPYDQYDAVGDQYGNTRYSAESSYPPAQPSDPHAVCSTPEPESDFANSKQDVSPSNETNSLGVQAGQREHSYAVQPSSRAARADTPDTCVVC